LTGLCWAVQ
jgi:hypothetical protein